jgi:hypothetical protein
VTSLPFVDQDLNNRVPKSKVAYLIKAQQDQMMKDPSEYIKDLLPPTLSFVESEQFEQEVARVQQKLQQKGDSKKKEAVFPDVPKKVPVKDLNKVTEDVERGILAYEGSVIKQVNL